MKRKVIQDFANVCVQMFLTSHSNSDRINFVIFGSGIVVMDFLSQRCTHNKGPVSPFFYCTSYREWLEKQCAVQGIDMGAISAAQLTVKMEVRTFRNVGSGVTGWMSTSMDFDCSSRIVAYMREYTSNASETNELGLGQILKGNEY